MHDQTLILAKIFLADMLGSKKWMVLGLALFFPSSSKAASSDSPLTIEFLGPSGPSSFPRLLKIRMTNETFANMNLAAVIASLQLSIDGKDVPTRWPVLSTIPIAPLDARDLCVALDDNLANLPVGTHTLQLHSKTLQSNALPLKWAGPKIDPSSDLNAWHKEINHLAEGITDHVSRSCIELWFPTVDGDDQSPSLGRYYLGAGVKVDVPYDERGGADTLENRVHGKVRVYQENRLAD